VPKNPATDEALPPRLLQDTAALFGLLSATVRLHILFLLTDGNLDVGTLAEKTGQSVATVSHHLGVLRRAGLISDGERRGMNVYYRAQRDALGALCRVIDPTCC